MGCKHMRLGEAEDHVRPFRLHFAILDVNDIEFTQTYSLPVLVVSRLRSTRNVVLNWVFPYN